VLIVTPASLKAQWAREIDRYAGRRAVVLGGGIGRRRELLSVGAPYVIVNYELLWRDIDLAREVGADVVVLDEAQRAKNFRTRTAGTLRELSSRFLFVLTGTPVENRLDDLYSLMQLVDPEVLGPLWRFNLDFHVQTSRSRRAGYRNLSALRERIGPFVLRRRKEEVLSQLPPLSAQTRYVDLTEKQRRLESALRGDAAKLMATAQKRALTPREQKQLMALLLKARQACNAAELCDPGIQGDGSGKLDELEQLVGEIVEQGGAKVLVFSEWTEMLRMASARLDAMGVGHGFLHGGVPTDKRPALLARFADDPSQRVLLSTDAGGVGLNLQVASYVIHLDLPWNPGRLDQRTARAHRLGQTRGVNVTYLCAATGIERGIEGTLAGKRAVRGAALDPDSDVDALDAPSFTVFVRELGDAIARAEAAAAGNASDGAANGAAEAVVVDSTANAAAAESSLMAALSAASSLDAAPAMAAGAHAESSTPQSPSPSSSTTHPAPANSAPRAADRLRLAQVVLDAGFPADAVRAAYDALAAEVRAQLATPPAPEHAALVAAVYRELVPTGRAPDGLMATLARLRDLTSLEAHEVPVDPTLAAAAVADARGWIERLAAGRSVARDPAPR
jgi:superfamily II DNA or RNA helicase